MEREVLHYPGEGVQLVDGGDVAPGVAGQPVGRGVRLGTLRADVVQQNVEVSSGQLLPVDHQVNAEHLPGQSATSVFYEEPNKRKSVKL